MDFSLNDDHIALSDAVARFCEQQYPQQQRGDAESEDSARSRWQALAELGLLGLPLSDQHGGSGLGAVEMLLAAQEFGRVLGGHGWLSSVVMSGCLLQAAGNAQQANRWLPGLATGRLKIALAMFETEARYQLAHVATRALREQNQYVLNGSKSLVLDGGQADLLLVVARTSGDETQADGLSLFAIASDTPGLHIDTFTTLDNRRAAHLRLNDVRVGVEDLIGIEGAAYPVVELAQDRAIAALCGEATGALDTLVMLCAEQLRTRRQFGAPLAKFQVLQHRLADMLIALESCKSMAYAAAMAIDAAPLAQRRRLVSSAKVLIGQAGREVGNGAIQMFGAMGMTDACRVGHYVKRLMVINQLFGDSHHHLRLLAAS